MNKDTTIVICTAGMGTRLGIGTTKALVHICGKPIIIHQLELLRDFDDVRIVLGYQAERVIEVVNAYRKDIMYAFNYDYKNNGAAASLTKGLQGCREYVVSMDGDLLVKPNDFKRFMEYDGECIAVSEKISDEPIGVEMQIGRVIRFTKESQYEWPGLVKVKRKNLMPHYGHIYEMLESVLPLEALYIESRDIDTPEDYENATSWVQKGYK